MSADSIERAIELNGVAVGANQNAFRAGRLAVAEPGWLAGLELGRPGVTEAAPEPIPRGAPHPRRDKRRRASSSACWRSACRN